MHMYVHVQYMYCTSQMCCTKKKPINAGDNSTICLLSDSPPPCSPELSSWVADLCLTVADENILLRGEWLSASHISAAHRLMKCQFPSQNGLQDSCVLQQRSVWSSKADNFVQIIYISPGHWACLSNKFSPAGQVDLYDSLHTRPNKDGTIVPQACLILHTSEPQLTLRVINVGIQQGYDDWTFQCCNGLRFMQWCGPFYQAICARSNEESPSLML